MSRLAINLLRAFAKSGKKLSTKQRKKYVDEMFKKKDKKPTPLTEKQRIRFLMRKNMNYLAGGTGTVGAAGQYKKRKQKGR